ncbi:MAG TPA: RES family NAD+ phosphorylase [Longimicrobium sp.]
MKIRRTVWRHVPAGSEPLHIGWMELARGRWNTQRPRLACLYTAITRAGAIAEYRKHFEEAGLTRETRPKPRDLVSITVDVSPVLNLTSDTVLRDLRLSGSALTGPRRTAYPLCHRVAREAVDGGYRAILAPSAAREGERVLLVYPEASHGKLLLRNGPDRIPLNYGTAPLV